jgi:hypothetical protein
MKLVLGGIQKQNAYIFHLLGIMDLEEVMFFIPNTRINLKTQLMLDFQ